MRAVATDDVSLAVEPDQLASIGRPLATLLAPSVHGAAIRSPPARTSVHIGSVVRERFELEAMIGEGGMGVVYRAVDRLHKEMQDRDPYVAIKILNSDLKRHPSALIALQRETRKAQILAHENIINVHSFDRDGSIVYMTMELLDGKSLRAVVADHAATGLPATEATPMIRSMAKALAYAHANGIVHADFKPANVFLTCKNQIKVLDFGLARATPAATAEAGSPVDSPALGGMTPAYASPDVLAGNEPTPADDVFALAIVSFELLTGRHPFDYDRVDTARLPSVRARPLPGLSRSQRKALMRAFEVESARRQRNAGEFLREFDGQSTTTRALQGLAAAAVLLPIAAFFFGDGGGEPSIAFEDLSPEVRGQFELAVGEGQTALSFGAAGINDALLYFSTAYDLHPNNPRALRGLDSVAEGFIGSLASADAAARTKVFEALYCNDHLSRNAKVIAACDGWLGATQCAAIAARCQASATTKNAR